MCIDDDFHAPYSGPRGWASFAVWRMVVERDWHAAEDRSAAEQRLNLLGDLLACVLLFAVIWHCNGMVAPVTSRQHPEQHQCAIKPWQHSSPLPVMYRGCAR